MTRSRLVFERVPIDCGVRRVWLRTITERSSFNSELKITISTDQNMD